ncbi:hypothetical protein L6164_015935 [Bauhinia variegata]|uniref:Uncharacterized protein n=1 Tax=Bauhinia variegata TaxID=167791 RepID=A0ACB9NR03_BAUVA|nr:hypothetical protein L6164_015935 [Bauhinia variegata]
MSDQQRSTYGYGHGLYESQSKSTHPSRQTIKFVTAVTIGVTLLLFSALTLTGTVISLILATPLLVLFSPILVPAAIVLFLAATGFMFSGGCGVAAATVLTWMYNYVAGKYPPGSDRLDYASSVISDKASAVKDMAKDYGHYDSQDELTPVPRTIL